MGSSNSSLNSLDSLKGRHELKEPEEAVIPDNSYLLESGENSDVILLCGPDNKKYLTHRNVLSAQSDVFQALFENILETGNVIRIAEMTPETLDQLLKFLYSGQVSKMSLRDVLNLYGAAKRFRVNPLARKCLNIIKQSMKDDNICEILTYAEPHNYADLKDIIISYLTEKDDFLTTQKWQEYADAHIESAYKIIFAVHGKSKKI